MDGTLNTEKGEFRLGGLLGRRTGGTWIVSLPLSVDVGEEKPIC